MANDYDQDELLSANEVALVIRDETDTYNDDWAGYYDDDGDSATDPVLGKLAIDDFDIGAEKDDTTRSTIGTDENIARIRGNKSYTFEFTLVGEDASLFDKFMDDNVTMEVELVTNSHVFTLGGLDYEDFNISGSDGEAVEFSSSMSALSLSKSLA